MGNLTDAIRLAEERKEAATGEDAGIVLTRSFPHYSGFDFDQEELVDMATRAGELFTHLAEAQELGLRPLFTAAWAEGLLVGLIQGRRSSET